MATLSAGSIRTYLAKGHQPITSKAVFQLLNSRPIQDPRAAAQGQSKVRLCISDGVNTCTQAMLVLGGSEEVPANNSILQMIEPTDPAAKTKMNSVSVVKDKYIWVIHDFRVLQNGGDQIDDPLPFKLTAPVAANERTPEQVSKKPMTAATSSRAPPPAKKARTSDIGGNNVDSVRRQLFAEEGPSQMQPTHLIKDLNPYQSEFRVKGRVVSKGGLRTFSNSRGEGQVFDLTLQDSSGDIKVTGFNDMAVKFHPMFQESKVYLLENASVKPANKNFNQTSHNYELSFHNGTKVHACLEASGSKSVPAIQFEFKTISEINGLAVQDTVDVIGVVVSIADVKDLTTRSGRNTKKREVRIADDSLDVSEILVTLWSEQAVKFDDNNINKVVGFRKVTIGEWQGKNLNVGFSASVFVEPEGIEEVSRLKNWFHSDEQKVSDKLASSTRGPAISSGTFCTINDVKSVTSGNDFSQTFTVEAYFISFKLDNLMYKACPTDTCRRGVVEQNSGSFRCEKCDKMYPECDMRYILQATIADMTDYHYVTLFNDPGRQVLGLSAKDLKQLENDQQTEFKRVINKAKHTLFKLTLKSKMETWNDEKRLKLSVINADLVKRDDPERLARIRAEISVLQV